MSLVFSIIRKNELKPVIIRYIDEQFEVPKVRDETVLTLMMRDLHKILSMPKAIAVSNHATDFPDINQTDLTSYLRIFKGDHNYMTSMYEVEKAQIIANHEEEKELYGDDLALVQQALSHIDQEVADWTSRLATPLKRTISMRITMTTHHCHFHCIKHFITMKLVSMLDVHTYFLLWI